MSLPSSPAIDRRTVTPSFRNPSPVQPKTTFPSLNTSVPTTPNFSRPLKSPTTPQMTVASPPLRSPLSTVSKSSQSGVGVVLPPLPIPSSRRFSSHHSGGGPSNLKSNATVANTAPFHMAKTMTIEEMRQLHHKALADAEAKRTELRLVLASRYRELVGSSDEVIRMRERSEELHQLVHALPKLIVKLVEAGNTISALNSNTAQSVSSSETTHPDNLMERNLRRDLSNLPRQIHRALDRKLVYKAATLLLELFSLIATYMDQFPLANALIQNIPGKSNQNDKLLTLTPLLRTQLKMTYLHVETIPARTLRMAKLVLLENAIDAQTTAAAICTLNLLQLPKPEPVTLLDLYFDSKAKLLQGLLNQLVTTNNNSSSSNNISSLLSPSSQRHVVIQTDNAEAILSQIVAILQHDIILHPYQIFIQKSFTDTPLLETDVIKTKTSHFLAAHLPLIRTKVKSVLVTIAGTTASALGQIRQSLYDKTDGALSTMDDNWQDAVRAVIDVKIVLSQQGTSKLLDETRKFSLWSALFSNTFSNLVHSLLTTSFHSVHMKVASTLRTSLANAPPFSNMLPHEAYRNTLKIATEMNNSLLKVSDDAHELLVHAEEREESERRLRQSLYVQTCEIMGRLICELRRMLLHKMSATEDATKELLVGRLCHLLKFRLTALDDLLNPHHSPAVLGGGGMISLVELRSAFELADDNDDGLITFDEAMEAVDSAFSGTQFHGAEMVRETLLLSNSKDDKISSTGTNSTPAPSNVTLQELVLLSARGLTHEESGPQSAIGTIQKSLDDIIDACFSNWAKAALASASTTFQSSLSDFLSIVGTTSESEWQRIYGGEMQNLTEFSEYLENESVTTSPSSPFVLGSVSPYIVGYMLSMASVFHRSICPSDSVHGSSLLSTLRITLWKESIAGLPLYLKEEISHAALENACPSAVLQLRMDVGFVRHCLVERVVADNISSMVDNNNACLLDIISDLDRRLVLLGANNHAWLRSMEDCYRRALEQSDLYFNALFGPSELQADLDVSLLSLSASSFMSSSSHSSPLNPLPSSRRFALLPIPESDRSLAELQRRRFDNNKDEASRFAESSSGSGVIGSGLGFFSSMLKKK
jgi:Vps51/Vps67